MLVVSMRKETEKKLGVSLEGPRLNQRWDQEREMNRLTRGKYRWIWLFRYFGEANG